MWGCPLTRLLMCVRTSKTFHQRFINEGTKSGFFPEKREKMAVGRVRKGLQQRKTLLRVFCEGLASLPSVGTRKEERALSNC